jgi:peptidoglycan/xylan/chitin deacetylase (PgdA/CDA1 family)
VVSSGTKPAGWFTDSFGDNDHDFRYVPAGAPDGGGSFLVTISRRAAGDAKWFFLPVVAAPGKTYHFSDQYKASEVTSTIAEFRDAAGKRSWRRLGSNPKSASWRRSEFIFAAPKGAVDMTILHVLSAVGTLATARYDLAVTKPKTFKRALVTLTFDDGYKSLLTDAWPVMKRYKFRSTDFIIAGLIGKDAFLGHPVMTKVELDKLAQDGNEIQSHTLTHPYLTKVSPAEREKELGESKDDLAPWNPPIDTVGLPYGDYNEAVMAAAKKHYAYCRTSDEGYNALFDFDPYRIRVEAVIRTTTLDEVKTWLARAKEEKLWLVLLYHNVGFMRGDEYTVAPEAFEAQLGAIHDSGLAVLTMRQALSEISSQLPK